MTRQMVKYSFVFFGGCAIFLSFGCKKLVQVPPPVGSITTSATFSTDQEATEAMAGIYNGMINGTVTPFNGATTIYCGTSADEIQFFDNLNNDEWQFQINSLLPSNSFNALSWVQAYSTIYGCNAVLSGIAGSASIHDSVRNELVGEAELVRAVAYFYLTNLYGNIPYSGTIDYNKTRLMAQSPNDTVYSHIIADLRDAQSRLPEDYSVGHGEKIVPNRWAATAFLARVYLYLRNWQEAEAQASSVLGNTGSYGLEPDLNNVFLANSREAIWQLQQSNQTFTYNGTVDGLYFIPYDENNPPHAYLTPTLLASFEDSDRRRAFWVDSADYLGITYYYPYKYRIGPGQQQVGGTDSAYYMVLRLGEQYLIRAEAEANGAGGGIGSAVTDLNMIRSRAGLGPYPGPMDKDAVLSAIYHERQVELFAEWGHRWLDLKRWGTAVQVLSANKGTAVTPTALLFPIPVSELQADPNLTQNEGYY